MRFRTTLLLFIILLGVGAYMYFVERPKQEAAAKGATLFAAETEDVTSVQLIYPDREVELVKDGDEWQMTKPVETRGDEAAVKSLLSSVVSCEVTRELKDPSDDPKAYGLDAPFVTASFGLKDGTHLPKTQFGDTTPVGSSAYARREGEQVVLLTSSACRSALDKQVKDLRDKTLLDFEDDDLSAFQIERTGNIIGVERRDGEWHITPGSYRADRNAVRTYLSSLRTVRAVEFPDDGTIDPTPYGLHDPRLRVRMRFSDGNETSISFGTELPNKNVYAAVSSLPGVYEVGEFTYRNLDKTTNDLREKTLALFDVKDLKTITVTRKDGGQYTIVRNGETWGLEGLEGVPKTDALHEYVGDVHDLSGYEILADDPQDLAMYGLDDPRLKIALTRLNGEQIGTILIGQMPGEETQDMTAMGEPGSTVYKIRSYVFTRLNRDPASLVESPPAAAAPAAVDSQ